MSIYSDFNKLNQQEKKYLFFHPHHAFKIKTSKFLALSETKKRFGLNGQNDKSDAFRHCFWSAVLARDLGYSDALIFTTAHESNPKNPMKAKAMDLHNNKVGLQIGKKGGSNNLLSNQCMGALSSGKLRNIL